MNFAQLFFSILAFGVLTLGFWTYMCVLTVVVGIVAIAWIFRDWRG